MRHTRAVLIVGGSGFIGTQLALKLREGYKVFATYHNRKISIPGVTALPVVLDNLNWMKRVIYVARPEVIIYAAGNNDVLWAENNARQAEYEHLTGVATILNIAEIFQPKLIYLSNCFLFDGHRGNYREIDTMVTNLTLGKAKVAGENFIRGKSNNYVIVRSSPLYGRGNGVHLSFLDRLRMSLDRKKRLELSAKEMHSFAPVEGLVEIVSKVADSGLKNKTFHYGGLTKLTYYEFAQAFARRFGYDPDLILPRRTDPLAEILGDHGGEEEEKDYSLNSTQAVQTLKIKPLLLEEGFDLVDKQLVSGL